MNSLPSHNWLVLRTAISAGLRWSLFLCLMLLLGLKGGTPWLTSELVAIPVGVIWAATALEAPRNDRIRSFQTRTLIFLGLLLVYVFVQTIPFPIAANPIWDMAEAALADHTTQSISVSPGQAAWSGVRMALPYVVFLSGLTLLQFEKDVEWLWTSFCILVTAFAVYGLVQLALFPDWLLFEEKLYYRDWFTGTLVNRNSAATLLGLGVVSTTCLVRWTVRSSRRRANRAAAVIDIAGIALPKKLLTLMTCGSIQMLALGLTASRGGLLATVLAVIVAVALLDFRLLRGRFGNKAVIWAAIVLLGMLGLELFAGRTLYRLETTETDGRLCAFQSTFEAALVNLPFGTGLGSFQDVYPSYRSPNCGIEGVWDKAHNSYLENFLELGLPYLGFLGFATATILLCLITGYRDRAEYRPFVVGGIASTVLVSTHALVDFSLQIPAIACFYALLLSTSVTTSLARTRSR